MTKRTYWFVVCVGLLVCVLSTIQTWPNNAVAHMFQVSTSTNQTPTEHALLTVSKQSVIGHPTLRPDFLNQVLAAAHSPAQGTGQALYDLSVRYGIDDAYALAFFQHESMFGTTGVARSTLSLGNIRCSAGYRCMAGYRAYASWIAGYADWYQLISNLYIRTWHLTTVEQIVPVYAPASDGNDVAGYIAAVEQDVARWRKGER